MSQLAGCSHWITTSRYAVDVTVIDLVTKQVAVIRMACCPKFGSAREDRDADADGEMTIASAEYVVCLSWLDGRDGVRPVVSYSSEDDVQPVILVEPSD